MCYWRQSRSLPLAIQKVPIDRVDLWSHISLPGEHGSCIPHCTTSQHGGHYDLHYTALDCTSLIPFILGFFCFSPPALTVCLTTAHNCSVCRGLAYSFVVPGWSWHYKGWSGQASSRKIGRKNRGAYYCVAIGLYIFSIFQLQDCIIQP